MTIDIDFSPIKVDIQVEDLQIQSDAFYTVGFISESDTAPNARAGASSNPRKLRGRGGFASRTVRPRTSTTTTLGRLGSHTRRTGGSRRQTRRSKAELTRSNSAAISRTSGKISSHKALRCSRAHAVSLAFDVLRILHLHRYVFSSCQRLTGGRCVPNWRASANKRQCA